MIDSEVDAVRRQIQQFIGRHPLRPIGWREVGGAVPEETRQITGGQFAQLVTPTDPREAPLPLTTELRPEVVVVPVMPDGSMTLVCRYRFGASRWSLELPRGLLNGEDASWKAAAERELLDGTGLVAARMSLVGGLCFDVQGTAENVYVVAAQDCKAQQSPAWDERLLIAGSVRVTSAALSALIKRGDVDCGLTVSAWALARLNLPEADR